LVHDFVQVSWVTAVGRDLRQASRRLRHQHSLSVVMVGTLALALAAGLVAFSVFSTLLLRPLPYPRPDELVSVSASAPGSGGGSLSAPDFLDLRDQTRGQLSLASYFPNVATLAGGAPPQHIAYTNVSGNFFAVLGVAPARGRALRLSDEALALPEVAVLSDGLWRQRYGGDPQILGRGINLDNRFLTVVGVMPAGFDFPAGTELWAPEPFSNALLARRSARFLQCLARLPAGGGLAPAAAALNRAAAQLAVTYPDTDSGLAITVTNLGEALTLPYRATLWLLLLAGLLLFGVAGANVANLRLAEAVGRRREMAIRASLGAGRPRLVAQLLTEAALLAALAGAVGWLLAAASLPLVRAWRPLELPQLAAIALDGRVLVFALGVVAATALGVGLAPAWEALHWRRGRSLQAALRADGSASRFQYWVAGAEVAITVVLLAGAGLLLQSVRRLNAVVPGFDAHQVLTFRASLLYNNIDELDAGAAYFRQLNQRLQTLPGVASAGWTSNLPLGPDQSQLHFYVPGTSAAGWREVERPVATVARVLPGYFRTLRIPLRGRDFTGSDQRGSGRVVIVSQNLARAWYPSGDALGAAIAWGRGSTAMTARIVGIAGDVRQEALAAPAGWTIYAAYEQSPVGDMSAVVRAARGNPADLVPELRRAAAALNPEIPLYQFAPLDAPLRRATAPADFRATLLLIMGLLALVLAAAGIYSLLAQNVARRTREIGVRMALGASAAQVRSLIMAQALRLMVGGALLGLIATAALAMALPHWLYGVHPGDPLVVAAVLALLIATGLVASYLPARQATKVDPVITLRCE
jgi:predicted permease